MKGFLNMVKVKKKSLTETAVAAVRVVKEEFRKSEEKYRAARAFKLNLDIDVRSLLSGYRS